MSKRTKKLVIATLINCSITGLAGVGLFALAHFKPSGSIVYAICIIIVMIICITGILLKLSECLSSCNGSCIESIQEHAATLVESADQLCGTTEELSRSSIEQSSATEEIAAEIQQIASQTESTTEKTSVLQSSSKELIKNTKKIRETMQSLARATITIKEVSEKVTSVADIIKEISGQTNLLALNASIEAARAGDAGKGFAVVADNIKSLALKSQQEVDAVYPLMKSALESSQNGELLAEQTSAGLDEINAAIIATARLSKEINDSAVLQQTSVAQINKAINSVNNTIQSNSAIAEETTASCKELADTTYLLRAETKKLN